MKHSDKVKYKDLKNKNKKFEEIKKEYSFSKYIKVNDNWYGNYQNDTVLLHLCILGDSIQPSIYFSTYGNDDFGLIKRFISKENDINEIIKVFNEWKNTIYDNIPDISNKEYFKSLGFVSE